MLGRVWEKQIDGVNENCIVEEMDKDSVVEFLSTQETKDVLCLGARLGDMSATLNRLELEYPEKYNKKTVYASIRDNDKSVEPKRIQRFLQHMIVVKEWNDRYAWSLISQSRIGRLE